MATNKTSPNSGAKTDQGTNQTGNALGGRPQHGEPADATDAAHLSVDRGTRHPSPAEVHTQARDEADAGGGTHTGFNEADEANERKAGRSDGNMTDQSRHNPGEPENKVHPNG